MPGGLPRGGDMGGFGIDRYISVTEILAEYKTTFTFIPLNLYICSQLLWFHFNFLVAKLSFARKGSTQSMVNGRE